VTCALAPRHVKLSLVPDDAIEIRVKSQPENLCAVRSAVETAATRMGMGEKAVAELVIAVDEAVSNVIRHGYKGDPNQPIDVRVNQINVDGRPAVHVDIIDSCPDANVEAIIARPIDLEDPKPGGLGVNLIRRSMDHVEVSKRTDAPGLRLSMYKYIEPNHASDNASNTDSQGNKR